MIISKTVNYSISCQGGLKQHDGSFAKM